MASADVTVGDYGTEFEADATQHTATLTAPGGGRYISNTGTKPAIISFDNAAALVLAQPAGAGARYLSAGSSEPIPATCTAISFLSAAAANNTYLSISSR